MIVFVKGEIECRGHACVVRNGDGSSRRSRAECDIRINTEVNVTSVPDVVSIAERTTMPAGWYCSSYDGPRCPICIEDERARRAALTAR